MQSLSKTTKEDEEKLDLLILNSFDPSVLTEYEQTLGSMNVTQSQFSESVLRNTPFIEQITTPIGGLASVTVYSSYLKNIFRARKYTKSTSTSEDLAHELQGLFGAEAIHREATQFVESFSQVASVNPDDSKTEFDASHQLTKPGLEEQITQKILPRIFEILDSHISLLPMNEGINIMEHVRRVCTNSSLKEFKIRFNARIAGGGECKPNGDILIAFPRPEPLDVIKYLLNFGSLGDECNTLYHELIHRQQSSAIGHRNDKIVLGASLALCIGTTIAHYAIHTPGVLVNTALQIGFFFFFRRHAKNSSNKLLMNEAHAYVQTAMFPLIGSNRDTSFSALTEPQGVQASARLSKKVKSGQLIEGFINLISIGVPSNRISDFTDGRYGPRKGSNEQRLEKFLSDELETRGAMTEQEKEEYLKASRIAFDYKRRKIVANVRGLLTQYLLELDQ
jgi:hypothetical protein